MLPGVEFVEMTKNQQECQCCGGGGNLEMIDAELSGEISKRKIDQALEHGGRRGDQRLPAVRTHHGHLLPPQ